MTHPDSPQDLLDFEPILTISFLISRDPLRRVYNGNFALHDYCVNDYFLDDNQGVVNHVWERSF